MSTRTKLRLASLIMFIAAAVFVLCAISAPNLGSTIKIGGYIFGDWDIFYRIYVIIMFTLFIVSFFVKKNK